MLVYWASRPWVKVGPALHAKPMSETAEFPLSFEAALAELEALVTRMESGELPLAESLAAYKRGAELLAHCQAALKEARQQVQVLEKGVLQPFAADEPDDA